MRLGGWSRIGIVLAVLYGALVAAIAYSERPRLERLHSAWFYDAAEVIAKTLSKSEGKEWDTYKIKSALLNESHETNISWLEGVANSPSERQAVFSAAVKEVNAKHRAEIAQLPDVQRQYWLAAFCWWAGGVALIFLTGWTVRWIVRGFRKRPV